MAINVIMPRQGQSVETCIIGDLLKKKGDQVTEGEIILTFETDKAQFDLESPASGILLELFCKSGDEVAVLSNVAVIGEPGESTDDFPETSQVGHDSATLSDSGMEAPAEFLEAETTATVPTKNEGDKIRISPRARNLAARLDIDISLVKGTGPMGRILENDVENAAAAWRTTRSDSEKRTMDCMVKFCRVQMTMWLKKYPMSERRLQKISCHL